MRYVLSVALCLVSTFVAVGQNERLYYIDSAIIDVKLCARCLGDTDVSNSQASKADRAFLENLRNFSEFLWTDTAFVLVADSTHSNDNSFGSRTDNDTKVASSDKGGNSGESGTFKFFATGIVIRYKYTDRNKQRFTMVDDEDSTNQHLGDTVHQGSILAVGNKVIFTLCGVKLTLSPTFSRAPYLMFTK
jgi:hypothetical protein